MKWVTFNAIRSTEKKIISKAWNTVYFILSNQNYEIAFCTRTRISGFWTSDFLFSELEFWDAWDAWENCHIKTQTSIIHQKVPPILEPWISPNNGVPPLLRTRLSLRFCVALIIHTRKENCGSARRRSAHGLARILGCRSMRAAISLEFLSRGTAHLLVVAL